MVSRFTKKDLQQLLLLLLMYFAFINAHGQANTERAPKPKLQFKRVIIGADLYTFGFYSYGMMASTDQMEPIRGNSVYLTLRMTPQVAFQMQGNFLRASELTDVKTSHFFGGLKLSSNATRRLQVFLTPGVGLGSYQYSYSDYSDILMDFGATGGLDLHVGKRFVVNWNVHYRANIDLEPFFFSGLGLSIKL